MWGLLAYLVALFAAATVYFAASVKWVEEMFIDYRNFHESALAASPESTGPLGFYNFDYNTPMIVLANSAYVVLNFLADGLLLHRCYIIWNANRAVIALPAAVFLASTALSIATVVNNSLPNALFFGKEAKALATAWVVLSMTLNMGLTGLIVARLLRARWTLFKALGPEHARLYTSLAAILTESAAIYSIPSALFLGLYTQTGSAAAAQAVNLVLPPLSMAAALAPTLILARVAAGKAWRRETAATAEKGTSGIPMARHWSERHSVSLPSRPSASFPRGASRTRINADVEALNGHTHGTMKGFPLEVLKTEESVSSYM